MDQVGRLDQQIQLLEVVKTAGVMGGSRAQTWQVVRTLFAEAMSPASRERFFGLAEHAGIGVAFRIHYLPSITPANRIRHAGRDYVVNTVTHTGRIWTRIDCEEATRGA